MLSNTLDFHHDYSSKNFMLLGNTRMLVNPDKDTKGGTGKKNQRKRETTMGKQDKIFLPTVFLSTRCVLTPHVCGFEMWVARAIFLPLHP